MHTKIPQKKAIWKNATNSWTYPCDSEKNVIKQGKLITSYLNLNLKPSENVNNERQLETIKMKNQWYI